MNAAINQKIVSKTVVLDKTIHNKIEVVMIKFPIDEELGIAIRKIKSTSWSRTLKSWYAPYSIAILNEIKTIFDPISKIDAQPLKDKIEIERRSKKDLNVETLNKIEKFKSWMQSRRYSDNTIETYLDALKTFLKYYHTKTLSDITNDDVIEFNNEYILEKKLSSSYQNQVVNAIKLFFKTIQNTNINAELIHRPKRQKLLPNVLSKEEVKLILEAPSNLKHKAMLSLIYSCGLRCGEVLQLKPEHIDSKRGVLIIKQSKGRKDRMAPLSAKTVDLLRIYFAACKPTIYLFEGQKKGEQYDARSLQLVLKQSIAKAKINKPVSLHWLRHSYATHLLENGTDLRYIQEILGHSSSKTTEIYTHVSTKSIQKIVSPFDSL
jgi:integrase/recombinase XerD